MSIVQLAIKELTANLKSWWILIMGAICALLAWMIGGYGFAFAGEAGRDGVLVSLVHLQLYIVPLLGLLLACDAVLGERDSGMFDVHLTLGVDRWGFLLGKWLGVFASLSITLIPSLALQAWSLRAVGGSSGEFAALLLYGGLLGSAVVSTGMLISSCSLNRRTVISLCIGTWLLLALLLDFLVVGLLAATAGDVSDWLINGLILANPLGGYRLLSYLHFFPDQVEPLLHARHTGAAAAIGVLGVWVVAPVLLTGWRLTRLYRPLPVRSGAAA